MSELHIVTVKESSDAELTAAGAQIIVRIAGQSFFTGNEAFKKAQEVADCTAALKRVGVTEDDITLASVTTEIETGILSKTSSAIYHLSVRVTAMEAFGPALAAISSQKNAKIAGMSWHYPDLDETKAATLQNAVRASKVAATQIAIALGTTVSAVHKLSYEFTGIDTEVRTTLGAYSGKTRAKHSTAALDQLNLFHKTRMLATVTADYVIEPFTEQAG
ncbi:MAG: SIMPL domain-containing protein [Planctomycetes bacterium]|nr:SIMPL domain-containing protein [Planctomycetota bacterium]